MIDALWPDDPLDRAAPKLHKAAHYVRRAFDRTGAIVLRDERVMLFEDDAVSVDAVRFEQLAERAVADRDTVPAQAAVDLYRGDLLPHDLYEVWTEARRDLLRLRHLDLLRVLERWEVVVELEPTDELAHVALMRRYAANGDRHAALRQFERMERALRGELGVVPGPDAVELRDRLLGDHDLVPRRPERLVGRDRELGVLRHALDDAAGGRGAVVIVSGAAGMGKSALVAAATERGRGARLRGRTRCHRHGRGLVALRAGARGARRSLPPAADPARRPGRARSRRDRAGPRRGGREPGRETDLTSGCSSPRCTWYVWRRRRAASFWLSTTSTTPTTPVCGSSTTSPGRPTRTGSAWCSPIARPRPAARWRRCAAAFSVVIGASEVMVGPLAADRIDVLVRGWHPRPPTTCSAPSRPSAGASPFAVTELARRATMQPGWIITLDADILGGVEAATRDALQRVAVVGERVRHRRVRGRVGPRRRRRLRPPRRRPRRRVIEPTGTGYRFRHGIVRDALLDGLPPHRMRLCTATPPTG